MNIVSLIAILCVIAAFASVGCCIVAVFLWLQLRDTRRRCDENALMIGKISSYVSDPNKVHLVEIEQPADHPIPVVAMQPRPRLPGDT